MKSKMIKKKITTQKKNKMGKKKKNLAEVTTDDFFNQNFESNDSDGEDNDHNGKSDSEESELDAVEHKKSLRKLKDTDPEFYTFLQKNDKKLLNFELSDEEPMSDNDDDETDKHIPNENLEIASDESDYEDKDAVKEDYHNGPTKITLKILKQWQNDIQQDKSAKTIKKLVEAFHAALITVSDPDTRNDVLYKIEGSAVFNAVVQLCIINLPIAFKKFLKIKSETDFEAHKSKRFPKIKNILKSYLKDLLQVLQHLTSSDILTVLLKHLHQMLSFTQSFSGLNKLLTRILLNLWATGEESVRVVAFLNIFRIARKDSILEMLIKTMYIKYIENAKFVALNTLPGINFMRNSLVEIYLLDHNFAYSHAFLYIRQLAITLRNAMTLKKKEHFQAVYNWQYINSLRFWCDLISLSKPQTMLQSLLYPLVQIITGTIKLIPTSQFYPLRFHCTQMLITLSKNTGTFIPALPYLLEVLNTYDFNRKHTAVSMKPISFICILRVSKSQLRENGFKDSVIDNIYQLALECATKDSHMIYFPDMYVPCIMQCKAFLKKCKVSNFCKKMKQLLDKIAENAQFIENERKKITVDLSDMTAIKTWENKIKNTGTPLAIFYKSWFEINQSQKLKLLTQNDETGIKLPSVRKSRKRREANDNEDVDESDVEVNNKNNEISAKSVTKKRKTKHDKNNDNIDKMDIVEDAAVDDWN